MVSVRVGGFGQGAPPNGVNRCIRSFAVSLLPIDTEFDMCLPVRERHILPLIKHRSFRFSYAVIVVRSIASYAFHWIVAVRAVTVGK